MPEEYEEDEVIAFAKTNFRGQDQVFGIKKDDRRRHMYWLGKTGMGKSEVMMNMAIQDIKMGRGLAVVDPHGDAAERLLDFIPASRINDVVYFNPADLEYPIAFNVLENVNPEHKHLVASGLVGVYQKIWADSWGPRLEYILRNTILALLDYPGSTLLGINRMLVDDDYREKVVRLIKDPVVRSFWVDEYAGYNERFRSEAISPIQNKIGQFLSTAVIRNLVGQPKSTIDIRGIMDEGKILILNLSKGRIGEDNSALLGAMMITKIQLAAMSRVDIPESERRDFYLYVDEFQNFATESFADILSEARKYRLNLFITHQYITQMEEKVRDAVFGNVGTIATFRVGAADAELLEKEFEPVLTQTDIVNLPKFQIYIKLLVDGVAGDPFSANTLPPSTAKEGHSDKVISVSRERYSRPRKAVEEKIERWWGKSLHEKMAEKESGRGGKKWNSKPWDNRRNNDRRPPQNREPNRRSTEDIIRAEITKRLERVQVPTEKKRQGKSHDLSLDDIRKAKPTPVKTVKRRQEQRPGDKHDKLKQGQSVRF